MVNRQEADPAQDEGGKDLHPALAIAIIGIGALVASAALGPSQELIDFISRQG